MTPSDQDQRREVDRQVQQLFAKSAAFSGLPPEQRAEIQARTADIVETMAHNKLAQASGAGEAGGHGDPFAVPLIEGLPVPPGQRGGQQAGGAPQFTGGAQPGATTTFGPEQLGDFGTGIAVGVQQAGELLRQVNFPAFVAELIQGVFQAVVDASIEQMRAYGELVQGVAMSLSDFRDANVTQNQARDHLVSKFPTLMQINVTDEGPRVGLRPGADEDDLPNISQTMGLDQEITDLDDETIEELLVPAARNDLARSRQTLLATMLLMGINRIVVTDGKINARLKFSFSAQDRMDRRAQDYDYENLGTTVAIQHDRESSVETGEGYKSFGYRNRDRGFSTRSGESSRWSKGTMQYTSTPAIYLESFEDTHTTAGLDAQAKMSGDVSLNFRSETVDLNQLASAADIFSLERVRSAGRGAPGAPVGSPQAGGEGAAASAGGPATGGGEQVATA